MNNRGLTGIVAVVAVIAIIFALVQSQNLTQSQTRLAAAQTSAASTLSAAGTQASDAQNQTATALAQVAVTEQAQALATAEAQASVTLGAVVAQASTSQADVQNDAATQQAQALATADAQASATLGALADDAATTQADAQGDMATLQARSTELSKQVTRQVDALADVQGYMATVQAVDEALNITVTQQANDLTVLAAEASEAQNALMATQAVLQNQLADLQAQLQSTVEPTTTLIPTEAVTSTQTAATLVATQTIQTTTTPAPNQSADAKTPQQLCEAAAPVKNPETRSFTKADSVLQPNVNYFAIICTGAGAVTIDLLEKDAPLTVNNFVFLAQKGFYNNTTFHRVLPNFMAQGGDPTGTGTGGPGYKFDDEIVPTLTFDTPGRLAMANAGPNTNGSQFFITFGPQSFLDGGYTIFGQVVEGQANVLKIDLRDPETNPQEPGTALDTVLIITDPTKIQLRGSALPAQADVVKALDGVDALIVDQLVDILENIKLSQTTAEVISTAPETTRDDLETLLTAHHHQYRVSSTLNNKACDVSQIQFYSASYTLDAFATASDAAAALADPALDKITLESGFTDKVASAVLPLPYYTVKETVCDKQVIHALTYWQRGNFVITAQVIWPADEEQGVDVLDRVLGEFVGARLYEPLLVDVLSNDIQ